MTDPIADMLTRIRNALAVKKDEVVLPMSKIKHNIAKILEIDGWIEKTEVIKSKKTKFDELRIVLRYTRTGESRIKNLKRISKPGLRVYVSKDNLPKVLNNYGIALISTPEGIMTNKVAKKKGIGGEVICTIY
jgi:small subunit ribosomal protein S8